MNGDFFLNVDIIIIYVYLVVKNHQKISSFLTNIPFTLSRTRVATINLRRGSKDYYT